MRDQKCEKTNGRIFLYREKKFGCVMNHLYFASLLENYRRRMGMDSSVLSIRKALLDCYQNESYKLRDRQRLAMAKQRREEIEGDRIFRNRLKEIKEKEKEISKRYEDLRKSNARNVLRRQNNDFTEYYHNYFNVMEEATSARKSSGYPETNSSLSGRNLSKLEATNTVINDDTDTLSMVKGWRNERSKAQYQCEYHVQIPRVDTLTKPFLRNSRVETDRVFAHVQKSEMKQSKPPSPMGSIFANRLIEYYRKGVGLESDRKFPPVVGKTTRSSTSKLGLQKTNARRNGPLNVISPDYDILVIDNEQDNCV